MSVKVRQGLSDMAEGNRAETYPTLIIRERLNFTFGPALFLCYFHYPTLQSAPDTSRPGRFLS